MLEAETVKIKPFEYEDLVTGYKIRIEVTPYYFKLIIDDRTYYFKRESGEFDGTSFPIKERC